MPYVKIFLVATTANALPDSMETLSRNVNFAMEMTADVNHLTTRLEIVVFFLAARIRETVPKAPSASALLVESATVHALQDSTLIPMEPAQILMNAKQLLGLVVLEQFARIK